MRILHLINSVHPAEGGTVECVRQIASSLTQDGHKIEVASCADLPDDLWVRHFPVPVNALGPGWGKFAYTPRLRTWLRANLSRFDFVIINGLWQFQCVGAGALLRAAQKPYVIYAHGMLDPWSRRAHPFKYVKKLFFWLLFLRNYLSRARFLVFTSPLESELAKTFFPAARWNALIVGNGVDEPPPEDRAYAAGLLDRFPRLKEARPWLFLSRVHEKKGLEILLRAYAKLSAKSPLPPLLIMGDGEPAYVKSLQELSQRLGLSDRVVWGEAVYDFGKWEYFRMAELFVLPSHQENFGIVLAEALAVGLPVCTTRAVNIWQVLEESGAGLICDDNEGSLLNCLSRWLTLPDKKRAQMTDDARTCFERNFRIDVAARKLSAAMESAALQSNQKI